MSSAFSESMQNQIATALVGGYICPFSITFLLLCRKRFSSPQKLLNVFERSQQCFCFKNIVYRKLHVWLSRALQTYPYHIGTKTISVFPLIVISREFSNLARDLIQPSIYHLPCFCEGGLTGKLPLSFPLAAATPHTGDLRCRCNTSVRCRIKLDRF